MSGLVERFNIDLTPKDENSLELEPENSPNVTDPPHSQENSKISDEKRTVEVEESGDPSKKVQSVGAQAAVGVSTFALAYAIHKFTAPVRIGFTITAAPVIVRFLRAKGILKHPGHKK